MKLNAFTPIDLSATFFTKYFAAGTMQAIRQGFILFVFCGFLLSSCKKEISEKQEDYIKPAEIVNWFKEYKQKMPDAPNPIYNGAGKIFIGDKMVVRVSLESGEGEMFFIKRVNGKEFETLFFRRVGKYDNISKCFTGFYEIIDMNKFIYKKIDFVNGIKEGEFKTKPLTIKKEAGNGTIKSMSTVKNGCCDAFAEYSGTWLGALIYCLGKHLSVPVKNELYGGWNCSTSTGADEVENILPADFGGALNEDLLIIIFPPNPKQPGGQLPSPPSVWDVYNFTPGGGVSKPPSIDDLYPELNGQILDENVRIEYKRNYAALVDMYNKGIAEGRYTDLYAGMNSKEFIDQLKNNQLLALSIDPITILVKAGASGAADILVQMFFARLLDDNVSDWNDALSKVNWGQVVITMATGALPISNKYILAAVNAGSAVYAELRQNGFTSWDKLGRSFVEGFMGSLIGSRLGDLIADKFSSIGNFGRKLVTKFEGIFSYGTFCRWLGGGISNVSESLLTSKGIIASTRKMVGWGGLDKVAVIGRNMKERVIPYAEKMGAVFFDESNPMAAPYFTQEVLEDISKLNRDWGNNWPIDVILNSKLYKANQQFIRDLKRQGYTFVDLGGYAGSEFYDMEIKEIFN